MMAEVLTAVCAAETGVSIFKIALGSEIGAQLPAQKEQQRKSHKYIGQRMTEENKRSEHHDEIPVVNTAAAAALVKHHPALEGAEEKNTDHIADRIGQRNKNENTPVDYACKIECKYYRIESQPGENDRGNGFCGAASQGLSVNFGTGLEILFEVLLASHALKLGRKETQQHLKRKYNRIYNRQNAELKAGEHTAAAELADNIKSKSQKKHQASANKLQIMHNGSGGKLHKKGQEKTLLFLKMMKRLYYKYNDKTSFYDKNGTFNKECTISF